MNFWARLTLLDFRASKRGKPNVTPRLSKTDHACGEVHPSRIPFHSLYTIYTRGGDVEIFAETLSMMGETLLWRHN